MIVRVISGLIGALIIASVIMLGKPVIICAVAACAVIATYEFCRSLNIADIKPFKALCIIAGVLLLPIGYLWTENIIGWEHVALILFLCILCTSIYYLINFGKYNIADFAATILSIIYIPGALIFFIAVLTLEEYNIIIWLILAGTVSADTFAYFTGVLLGNHKIIPKISSKKTWEGSIGGLIGSITVTYFLGRVLGSGSQLIADGFYLHYAVIGLLTGTISQLGDWTASLFKRNLGIKDFGSIIPGHGGMLDRCDSFLFSVPSVYFYALLIMSR